LGRDRDRRRRQPRPARFTFYIEVPDVEAALAKAERLGGERMFGPDKVADEVEIGQFTDPEGHLVGLTKSSAA
jgi:predicted enzyme related to lactoylglutathione lyase